MPNDTANRTLFSGQYAGHDYRCWCGVQFALPESLYREYVRQNDVRPDSFSIYCPLGHSTVPKGNEIQDLHDEVVRERQRREQAEARAVHLEHQRRGTLGALRKVQKRVKHGVCPCCNRTFQNLGRHMETQHPHFDAETDDRSSA